MRWPLAGVLLRIYLFCALFLFVLQTQIVVSGRQIPLGVLAVLVTFFLLIANRGVHALEPLKQKKYLWTASGVLLIGGYSALIENIFGSLYPEIVEYAFLKIAANNLVYGVFGVMIVGLAKEIGWGPVELSKILFFVCLANAIVIFLEVVFPSVHMGIESILFQPSNTMIQYKNTNFNLRGLAAGSGAALSVFMGFSLIFGLIANEAGKLRHLSFILGSTLILLSCMSVGRTGLYFGILIFMAWILIKIKMSVKAERRQIFKGLFLASLFVFFFFPYFSQYKVWAFQLFYRLLLGSAYVPPPSLQESWSMLRLPWDPLKLLVGFGFFEANTAIRSDSGYIKTIFSVGIPLAIVVYWFYGITLFRIVKLAISEKMSSFFWTFGVGTLFFLELKEPFLYQNMTARALAIFIVSYLSLPFGRPRKDESNG